MKCFFFLIFWKSRFDIKIYFSIIKRFNLRKRFNLWLETRLTSFMMINCLWILTLQECLTAFNIGLLSFLEGLESQTEIHDSSAISALMLLRVSLFQKTFLEALSRNYKKHQVIHQSYSLFFVLCSYPR